MRFIGSALGLFSVEQQWSCALVQVRHRLRRSSAVIRELVENREFAVDRRDAKNQRQRFGSDINKKNREKIVSACL